MHSSLNTLKQYPVLVAFLLALLLAVAMFMMEMTSQWSASVRGNSMYEPPAENAKRTESRIKRPLHGAAASVRPSAPTRSASSSARRIYRR